MGLLVCASYRMVRETDQESWAIARIRSDVCGEISQRPTGRGGRFSAVSEGFDPDNSLSSMRELKTVDPVETGTERGRGLAGKRRAWAEMGVEVWYTIW